MLEFYNSITLLKELGRETMEKQSYNWFCMWVLWQMLRMLFYYGTCTWLTYLRETINNEDIVCVHYHLFTSLLEKSQFSRKSAKHQEICRQPNSKKKKTDTISPNFTKTKSVQTCPEDWWASKALISSVAQSTCSALGLKASWTTGICAGCITCFPVKPMLAPLTACSLKVSMSEW